MILIINIFKNKKDNPLKGELEIIHIKKKFICLNIPDRIPYELHKKNSHYDLILTNTIDIKKKL